MPAQGTVPKMIEGRPISVRAFGQDQMLKQAVVIDGTYAATCFAEMLSDTDVEYLHMHFAAYGCYIAAVERAS